MTRKTHPFNWTGSESQVLEIETGEVAEELCREVGEELVGAKFQSLQILKTSEPLG